MCSSVTHISTQFTGRKDIERRATFDARKLVSETADIRIS